MLRKRKELIGSERLVRILASTGDISEAARILDKHSGEMMAVEMTRIGSGFFFRNTLNNKLRDISGIVRMEGLGNVELYKIEKNDVLKNK